jgi:dihydrofolate reductase
MRRVILQNMVSLDGYFEGPSREIDWHVVESEFNAYAAKFLDTLDALLFGRVTYQLMASYWPSADAIASDPIIARRMNLLPKVVFSRMLEKVEWENSRLVKGDAAAEVARLKSQPGRDLAIFGSSDLAVTLAEHGLIDEYRIMVNPVILGSGKPLFKGIMARLKLKHLQTRTFGSGVVVLSYEPAKT